VVVSRFLDQNQGYKSNQSSVIVASGLLARLGIQAENVTGPGFGKANLNQISLVSSINSIEESRRGPLTVFFLLFESSKMKLSVYTFAP
jgi:hypothetical protein